MHRPQTDQVKQSPAPYVDEVTLEELRLGRLHAARLVKGYGAMYRPVFERLQGEVASRESREALLEALLVKDIKPADSAKFG